jgi:hypothetical protein
MSADRFTYQISWSKRENAYVGSCLEFPSQSCLGRTPVEALMAIQDWLSSAAVGRGHPGEAISSNRETAVSTRSVPRYHLDDLIAQCDLSAKIPADMARWDMVKPIGRELI